MIGIYGVDKSTKSADATLNIFTFKRVSSFALSTSYGVDKKSIFFFYHNSFLNLYDHPQITHTFEAFLDAFH